MKRSASHDDVKKSCHKLALKWHPDKNPSNKVEAEKKFKAVTEAHKVLSDPEKQSLYDRSVKESRSQTGRSDKGHHNSYFASSYITRDLEETVREISGGRDPCANVFDHIETLVKIGTGQVEEKEAPACFLTLWSSSLPPSVRTQLGHTVPDQCQLLPK